MSEDLKNTQNNTENEPKSIFDELIDKTKAFADKAEDFLEENVEKVKKSETYGKASEMVDKAGDYVEGKIEEFQKGEMGAKFDAFKEKAEDKAEDLYSKAKSAMNKMADDVEDAIDSVKEKIAKKGEPKDNA
jgi:ElaB/YqjD/DUF883 family membrane-anchored ribosome-binding protein